MSFAMLTTSAWRFCNRGESERTTYEGNVLLTEGEAVTENEWLQHDEPVLMLDFLRGKIGDRKLRLFGLACCRRIQRLVPNPYALKALQVAERFADGEANISDLFAA